MLIERVKAGSQLHKIIKECSDRTEIVIGHFHVQ